MADKLQKKRDSFCHPKHQRITNLKSNSIRNQRPSSQITEDKTTISFILSKIRKQISLKREGTILTIDFIPQEKALLWGKIKWYLPSISKLIKPKELLWANVLIVALGRQLNALTFFRTVRQWVHRSSIYNVQITSQPGITLSWFGLKVWMIKSLLRWEVNVDFFQ